MSEPREAAVDTLELAQATELTALVELEARWENLRTTPSQPREGAPGTQALLGVQRAYDAFRSKLVVYNKRHKPAHVPELLLNTPLRLATWCRAMRALYLRVEHDARVACPLQLLEKAYRRAERIGARLNADWVNPPGAATTLRDAIDYLDALVQWCDALDGAAGRSATSEATAPSGVPSYHAYSK